LASPSSRLVVSQLLTLYTTPVVYLSLDRLRCGSSSGATGAQGPHSRSRCHEHPAQDIVAAVVALVAGANLAPKYARPRRIRRGFHTGGLAGAHARGFRAPRVEDGAAADDLIRGSWWEMFDDPS